MPKNAQTPTQLHSSHTLVKQLVMFKILKARLQQYENHELPGVQAGFSKGRGTRDQIANIFWIIEKAREFQKNICFILLTMPKPLTVWITTNCGKFLKRCSMWSHRVGHDWSNLACMHALEKEMATHSSILAWRVPGTEEPGRLLSMGLHRVGHDWSNLAAAAAAKFTCTFISPLSSSATLSGWKICSLLMVCSKCSKINGFLDLLPAALPWVVILTWEGSWLLLRNEHTASCLFFC